MTTPEPFRGADPTDREAAASALSIVDEALDAGRVTTHDEHERELQELALALRAEAPVPAPELGARLDERLRRRLASPAESSRSATKPAAARAWARERLAPRRPPARVLVGAASVLVALLVGISLYAGIRDSGSAYTSSETGATSLEEQAPQETGAEPLQKSPRAAGEAKSPTSPSGDEATGESAIAPPPTDPPFTGPGGEALGRAERRIERSASMTLAAPDEGVAGVADDVPTIVERHRGFVLQSSVTTGDRGTTGGSFDIRVPTAELDATLSDLADLGQVRSQTQTDDDVTGAFVSTRDRLAVARAERRSLLLRLERATGRAEATALREQADRAARVVGRIRGTLEELDSRTAFAAVSLSLVADDAARSGTDDAIDDAVGSLLGAVNFALRVLGFALPLLIVAGVAWAATRAVRRRRREAALE